jgi:chromosome segregation ATPase
MNRNLKAIASLVLASAVTAAYAQPSGAAPAPVKHHHAHKTSIQEQIEELQEQMNQQSREINSLRRKLNERNEQLQQAQATAQQSQTAAQQAQSTASDAQQKLSDQTEAVTSLQTAVNQMKQQNTQVITSVKQAQAKMTKMVEHPDTIHYKGVTVSPAGSFI